MWMCLAFVLLARVLLASQQSEFLPPRTQKSLGIVVGERNIPSTGTSIPPTSIAWRGKIDGHESGDNQIDSSEHEFHHGDPNDTRTRDAGSKGEHDSDSTSVRASSSKDADDNGSDNIHTKKICNDRKKRSANGDNLSELEPVLDRVPSSVNWITFLEKLQEKKRDYFYPWGGKRVGIFEQGGKVRRPIRVPFNSWGGKRSQKLGYPLGEEKKRTFGEWGGKRSEFHSWGGKRASDDDIDVNADNVEQDVEKREFGPWGGKRSRNNEHEDEEMKRVRFNAWGGKRNELVNDEIPEEMNAKKNAFNAWGGKRFAVGAKLDEETRPNYDPPMLVSGYKESDGTWDLKEPIPVPRVVDGVTKQLKNHYLQTFEVLPSRSDIEVPERRDTNRHQKLLFNPWGGKRSITENHDSKDSTSLMPELMDFHKYYEHKESEPWDK